MTLLNKRDIKDRGNPFLLYAKIGVSIILVAVILYQCDWRLTWQTIRTTDPLLLALVFFCMVGGVIISAVKWQLLLSIHGAAIPLSVLNRYYFIAVFFNNFLPSSIGGDGFRIYKTATDMSSKARAVIAVLVERVSGLWALLFLGFLGGLLAGNTSLSGLAFFRTVLWLIGAGLILSFFLAIVFFVMSDHYRERTAGPEWLRTLFRWIHDYRRHPGKTLQVVLISFIFQAYALLWMLLLARAVGGNITIFQLAVAMMISNLAAMLPISLNGLGLMDGSFIYIASLMGMEYEHGVMMMLIMRVFLVFLSLIGAYFYIRLKKRPVRQ